MHRPVHRLLHPRGCIKGLEEHARSRDGPVVWLARAAKGVPAAATAGAAVDATAVLTTVRRTPLGVHASTCSAYPPRTSTGWWLLRRRRCEVLGSVASIRRPKLWLLLDGAEDLLRDLEVLGQCKHRQGLARRLGLLAGLRRQQQQVAAARGVERVHTAGAAAKPLLRPTDDDDGGAGRQRLVSACDGDAGRAGRAGRSRGRVGARRPSCRLDGRGRNVWGG